MYVNSFEFQIIQIDLAYIDLTGKGEEIFLQRKLRFKLTLSQRILNLSQNPADFYSGFSLMIYSEWSFLNVHFVTSFT